MSLEEQFTDRLIVSDYQESLHFNTFASD